MNLNRIPLLTRARPTDIHQKVFLFTRNSRITAIQTTPKSVTRTYRRCQSYRLLAMSSIWLLSSLVSCITYNTEANFAQMSLSHQIERPLLASFFSDTNQARRCTTFSIVLHCKYVKSFVQLPMRPNESSVSCSCLPTSV